MPPADRLVPRFAAEPPQEGLPYGRWAERLRQELLAACLTLDTEDEDLGEPGDITWYPDRSWHGRTYVPGTAPTSNGYELFGYVRYVPVGDDRDDFDFSAAVDFTDETAARNPEWTLDLCDEVIGSWRGEAGAIAAMTLVWGRPLVARSAVATAELAGVTVDQCVPVDDRFTLIAPDDYRGDLLKIKVFSAKGEELACESLYDAGDESAVEQPLDTDS